MSLQPYSEDYEKALATLRQSPAIVSKQLLGIVGQTPDGNTIFIPGSYEKGFADALVPQAQRRQYVMNLGVIGQLSDGQWVFPPSYDRGLRQGTDELRFAVLAEGERRLMRQVQELESAQSRMTHELERTRESVSHLEDELRRIKESRQ